jgi:hypothetical protein
MSYISRSVAASAATPIPTITPTSTFQQLFPVELFWGRDLMRTGGAKEIDSYNKKYGTPLDMFRKSINDELTKKNKCAVLLEKSSYGDKTIYLIIGKKGLSYDVITSDASDKLLEGELILATDLRNYLTYYLFKSPYTFEDIIPGHFARGPDEGTGDSGGEMYQTSLANFLHSSPSSSAAATGAVPAEEEENSFRKMFTQFAVKRVYGGYRRKKLRKTKRTRRNRRRSSRKN